MTIHHTAVSAGAIGPRPAGRAGLRHAARAEWTKLWSVRSTGWSLAVTAVAVIGIGVLATATTAHTWSTSTDLPDKLTFDPTRHSLTGFFLGQLAIGVLGALVVSAEYGTGTIRATLTAIPRRPVVLAAKVLVFGSVALVVSEALAFAAFFIGQAILSGSAPHAVLSQPGVARAVVESGLYLAALGLFALGLATVLRHTAGAITAYVVVLLVLPLIAQAVPAVVRDAVSRYLPANIGLTILSTRPTARLIGTPTFGPWAGLGILLAYTVVTVVVGGILLVRRDA